MRRQGAISGVEYGDKVIMEEWWVEMYMVSFSLASEMRIRKENGYLKKKKRLK